MRSSHVDLYDHDENAATYARDVLRSDDPIREGYTEVLDWSAQIARAVENGLTVIAAAVAGHQDEFVSYRSTNIIDPNGRLLLRQSRLLRICSSQTLNRKLTRRGADGIRQKIQRLLEHFSKSVTLKVHKLWMPSTECDRIRLQRSQRTKERVYDMSGKFYVAAPYNTREGSLDKVREIERLSGWTCNARWVLGLNDGKEPDLCARNDSNDLRDADALILLDGVSSTGGMWVELGMAIALSKKIIFVRDNTNLLTKPPVFCSLPEVIWVRNHQTVAGHLR